MNTPVMSRLHGPKVQLNAPYAAEVARSDMVRRFGSTAYTDGYQVITTIDSQLQKAANNALRQALVNYDRRHGYRGPIAQASVEEIINQHRLATNPDEDDTPPRCCHRPLHEARILREQGSRARHQRLQLPLHGSQLLPPRRQGDGRFCPPCRLR